MEAGKLMSSCIGSSHHPLCPPSRGIRRSTRACKIVYAVKSSYSCDTPSALSPQLSLLPVVGALSNLACLPVWAAEEASSSSAEAASTQVSEIVKDAASQVAESVKNAASQTSVEGASQAVQSSMESVKDAASQVSESVKDAASQTSMEGASQAVQSSMESVKDAASQTSVGDSSMLVNILGVAAFLGLSLLTVAVVYLFITDFLEKRKTDEEMKRLNEEAAAASKKKSGSLSGASKGGVKGFGRKRQIDDE